MIYTKVSIESIDHQNDQFQISYAANREKLTESIGKIGLIHPIILRRMESDDQYQIISGFQRVYSFLDLNVNNIDAIVYEHDELGDLRALLLSFHQTVTSRDLNLIEKSLVLNKLRNTGQLKKETILSDIMPLLNFEPHGEILEHASKLCELSDSVKNFIVENDVNFSNAVRFLGFTLEDQKTIVKRISPLKLGRNKLKEILTFIDEIQHRDEVSVGEIIDKEMVEIITNENIPTPQKAERLRGKLKEKRFPKLVSIEEKVQKNLKQLKLPQEVTLSIPPFLEGDKLKIEFSFKNETELKKIIDKLSSISDQKELKVILKML